MSRLSNYFQSKELVKLHLTTAEDVLRKTGATPHDRALTHLIAAVRELLVAQNNLVSLAFEKRSKLKRKGGTLQ